MALAVAPTAPTLTIVPQTPGSVTERAMLVNLSISYWSGGLVDKTVSKEVAQEHDADDEAGRYWKRLVGRSNFKAINKAYGDLKRYHEDRTLPWGTKGERIIMNVAVLQYRQTMHDLIQAYDDAVDAFVADLPAMMQQAAKPRADGGLGTMFRVTDYPTAGELRSNFGVRMWMEPLADSGDFRVDLGNTVLDEIKHDWDRARDELLDNAMRDAFRRIADTVGHMSRRLAVYKPADANGKAENTFKDSLVENVRELVDILPSLNITASQDLADLTERMRASLTRHDANTLRESAAARKEVKDEADAILGSLGGLIA